MYESPKIIQEVGEFLREPIPKIDIEDHIIGLEALRFELAKSTVEQLKLLQDKRKQLLWPKDMEKGLTELDRTTRLNADVSIINKDYEFLLRLETLVEWRLNCCLQLIDSAAIAET